MKIVLPLLLSLVTCAAMAADQGSRTPPHEMSAEMKTAFESCKESGKPGEVEFDGCMAELGFARPTGAAPGGDKGEGEDEVTAN
ncbi:hypothetical protein CF121_07060 [Aeromonas media]|uniref:hypothetical protein n=1 Tax=Aeromonas media TaxID=651 RepID=UPI0011161F79|nr:hypothetical protein [Aeromonas media]TNI62626.1 hypothetical protein CF121_07060 [Aeromonas media]